MSKIADKTAVTGSRTSSGNPETVVTDTPETGATVIGVVIGAFAGTENLIESIWTKMLPEGVAHNVKTVQPAQSLRDVIAELAADDNVADEFVYAGPNVVPCAPLSLADLQVSTLYVTKDGNFKYDAPLPRLFKKSHLASVFALGDATDADFVKSYITSCGDRPHWVGYTFGNFITPVNRGDPCENVVIEAILRKRFISATAEGFGAIGSLLRKALLK